MKNTKLSYMYRDADNYKVYRDVVFSGELRTNMILDELNKQLEMFVPSQIDLDDLQEELQIYDSQDHETDHCWHEITDITSTDEEPTDERTIHEFALQVFKTSFTEVEVEHILNK